jgi:hypothetical protein
MLQEHELSLLSTQHHFITNAAAEGVGQPIIIVNEANAASMHLPCQINNMEVIDGLNRAILETTTRIEEVIRERGKTMAASMGRGGMGGAKAMKLDRKPIEVSN